MYLFSKVNFEDDSRGKYLELLGYRREDLGKKVNLHRRSCAVGCMLIEFSQVFSDQSQTFNNWYLSPKFSVGNSSSARTTFNSATVRDSLSHTPRCLLRRVTVAWQREGGFMGRLVYGKKNTVGVNCALPASLD